MFETPSFTKKDRFMQSIIEDKTLQEKLAKVKNHFQSEKPTPAGGHQHRSLQSPMKAPDMLKKIANQDKIKNIA